MKRCCTCCLGRETTPPSYATERIPCKAKAPLLPGRQTPSVSPSAAERCETTMGPLCTWCITTRSRLGYKSLSFASVQVMPSIALQNVKQIETSKSHNVLSTPHVLKFPRWVARRWRWRWRSAALRWSPWARCVWAYLPSTAVHLPWLYHRYLLYLPWL